MTSQAPAHVPAVDRTAGVLHFAAKDILKVTTAAPDRFIGAPSAYPWGWVFGGHLLAQALLSAGATVDPTFVPHSLHASFVRKGDTTEDVRYEVERLRDGRSYCTRRVVGSQSSGVLITVQASFAAPQRRMVSLPPGTSEAPDPPEGVLSARWTTAFERFEVPTETSGRVRWWYRLSESGGSGDLLQAAALAFLSDDLPAEAVADAHHSPPFDRLGRSEWVGASLDHAIWFHAPVRADAWHLHDFRCVNYSAGRGLALGMIFDQDGRHVATVSQETHLIRD